MNTKATILFVEDDASLSFVIKDNLEEHGYQVIHCNDGESAWQQFMKHSFDLCLLDVMLPKKDGFTLAAQIRKKNELLPIVMLTAKTAAGAGISFMRQSGTDICARVRRFVLAIGAGCGAR